MKMKWIESKEATLLIMKHGMDMVREYQKYLDCDVYSLFDCTEILNEDTGKPLDFSNWIEVYEEELADQIEWENSEEFQNLLGRLD
jgi:hypothetical protein